MAAGPSGGCSSAADLEPFERRQLRLQKTAMWQELSEYERFESLATLALI